MVFAFLRFSPARKEKLKRQPFARSLTQNDSAIYLECARPLWAFRSGTFEKTFVYKHCLNFNLIKPKTIVDCFYRFQHFHTRRHKLNEYFYLKFIFEKKTELYRIMHKKLQV